MSVLQPVSDHDNPMILTENQQGNEILEKLKFQKDNEKFCDVIIFVDSVKFNLHRNVLASISPYFDRLFQSNRITKERFRVTSHSADIFKYFVNYMYTGSIVIHKNNVNDLLKLAYRLEVERLKVHCAEYLERHMDVGNCLQVKATADKHSIQNLGKQARLFIKANLNEILNQQLMLPLDHIDLDAFFLDLEDFPQHQILGIIFDWLRYDISNRERKLSCVIKHIKCSQLDPQYLSDFIESNPIFLTSEIALYTILKHLHDNGSLSERFVTVFQQLGSKYGNLEMDSQPEIREHIQKLPSMLHKKNKRILRGNPIARLAALRSALLLRHRKVKSKKTIFRPEANIILKEESDTSEPLKCHLCSHYSSDTTALEQHLSVVHSRDVTYKCGVCGYVCQWNNLYIDHMKSHFPGPPYKCDTCSFSSDKLNSVLTHRSDHLEEKALKCQFCSFRCRSSSNLQAHVKCHNTTERRTYSCDICGFSTKFLSHLVAHKRIHSTDVYRCSYPHCKFTTAKKTQLGSHAKIHTQGSRPHCCQICGRGFLEKSHLVRHERIHLEEKPFKCPECDYASSRRDKLKEHQARHHGDHASAKVPYKARPNKKSSQIYPETYSPSEDSGRSHHGNHSNSTSGELPEVVNQHHNIPLVNSNSYPIFPGADTHHAASSSAFHQQQLLNGSSRVKDHRSVHQTTAAAVTAAMMLDPRFHHGGSGAGPYVASVPGVVPQTAGQAGHQVSDYPSALMSLF